MHRIILVIVLFTYFQIVATEIVDCVVAKVNDRVITYSEIIQEGYLLNIENSVPAETELSDELKVKVLDLLIFRNVLFVSSRDKNIAVKEVRVMESYNSYIKKKEVKRFLKKFEISALEFKIILRKRLVADKMAEIFIKKKFKGKSPTEAKKKKAVENWYEKTLKSRAGVLIFYSRIRGCNG